MNLFYNFSQALSNSVESGKDGKLIDFVSIRTQEYFIISTIIAHAQNAWMQRSKLLFLIGLNNPLVCTIHMVRKFFPSKINFNVAIIANC